MQLHILHTYPSSNEFTTGGSIEDWNAPEETIAYKEFTRDYRNSKVKALAYVTGNSIFAKQATQLLNQLNPY